MLFLFNCTAIRLACVSVPNTFYVNLLQKDVLMSIILFITIDLLRASFRAQSRKPPRLLKYRPRACEVGTPVIILDFYLPTIIAVS